MKACEAGLEEGSCLSSFIFQLIRKIFPSGAVKETEEKGDFIKCKATRPHSFLVPVGDF